MRAGTLPPVQKAVLCLLPNLAPADAPALWPDYLSALLDLLRPEQLAAAAPDAAPGRACEEGVGGDRCVRTWHAPPSEAVGVQLHMQRCPQRVSSARISPFICSLVTLHSSGRAAQATTHLKGSFYRCNPTPLLLERPLQCR